MNVFEKNKNKALPILRQLFVLTYFSNDNINTIWKRRCHDPTSNNIVILLVYNYYSDINIKKGNQVSKSVFLAF